MMMRWERFTAGPATPRFTAEKRLAEPTPTIEPVIVCVVETGMPKAVAPKSVIAPAVSAQKPPTGWSLTIFVPIVLTMRQPNSDFCPFLSGSGVCSVKQYF